MKRRVRAHMSGVLAIRGVAHRNMMACDGLRRNMPVLHRNPLESDDFRWTALRFGEYAMQSIEIETVDFRDRWNHAVLSGRIVWLRWTALHNRRFCGVVHRKESIFDGLCRILTILRCNPSDDLVQPGLRHG
ncbi:hypothetical protein [Bifidobacterium primatium]|uniref:hypothetical protein n=1 Tax=Bifidobacterium primatium TaxID=2045438 RepID=UPI001054D0F3|nr:hypothetical protein [Bifidobacterium primatium]